ncbi:MAG: hypothetical protein JO269_10520 [Burkholderiaceae bacterium]|nr:hypothetical protein [Burkholderiaceae bacterium]
MQNPSVRKSPAATEDESPASLQAYFKPGLAPEDIAQVSQLKKAKPLLQAFTTLFHGGFDSVLVRLLVLRELVADVQSAALTRADINARLGYLDPDSLETVLARLRGNDLLTWDQARGMYRVTPMARNILAALEGLIGLTSQTEVTEGEAEVAVEDNTGVEYLLSQVAGAQAVGGVTVEQLQHLLGRLVDLTEEFRDAIASGSEFRLRAAQHKWHQACDWVEKGSHILQAITNDPVADGATHRAAQAIGRAQSALLNMQGMFSRALNQIERQRVHLGQSGLSTTDINTWLMQHGDLASLAEGVLDMPVKPVFITPAEMIDVAEDEVFAERRAAFDNTLPSGENAPVTQSEAAVTPEQLEAWLGRLSVFSGQTADGMGDGAPIETALLPASFAIASYRASLLPLIGDESESALQGATAAIARLPLTFTTENRIRKLDDPHVAAMSAAVLAPVRAVEKTE